MTSPPIKLENWSVSRSPWEAPEASRMRITGVATGHPRWHGTHRVTTSGVVSVYGQLVRTESGSLYELGTPDPAYVDWCKVNGIEPPSEETPIRWLKGKS